MNKDLCPTEWFNLNLYDEAKEFSHLEWLEIIQDRTMKLSAAKRYKKNMDKKSLEWIQEHFDLLKQGKLEHQMIFYIKPIQVVKEVNEKKSGLIYPLLQININAPKGMIMKQFENWLDEKKKQTTFSKEFSETEVKKLIDNRILPLLDLAIYKTMKDITITNEQLADYVFPDLAEKGTGVEKIGNVNKILKTITSEEYTDWLYTQRYMKHLNSHK